MLTNSGGIAMTSEGLNPTDPYSLLRLGEAWRNRSGLTTLLITFVVVVLWVMLGMGGGVGRVVLTVVIAAVCIFVGLTAAGCQFMDQAAGRAVTPVVPALLASPMVLLRSVGLVILEGIVFLAFLAIAAIILVVCKMPGLGAVLFAVALPALTFLGALVFLGLTVASLVCGAALWEGHSFKAALSQGWVVITQRPMQGFLNIVLLLIVCWLVGAIVVAFVLAGFSVVMGLTAAMLGSEIFSEVSGVTRLMMGGGYGESWSNVGALVVAGVIGIALVIAVVMALFVAMLMLGFGLTYLKITRGLDISATESALDSAIAKSKEKAQQVATEAKQRAQEAQASAQQRLDQARTAQAARAAAGASPTLACPQCHVALTANDVFCGNCGFKLDRTVG